jgi:uncharacterized repeat protein (TIGR02059 family)
MSEDLKALFRRLRKKDLAYYGNLGSGAQGGSGGGGGAVADTTAPEISSAVVPAAGTTLGLTYNENLLASGDGVPDIADYSLSAGGTAVTISAVSVSGAIVTLELARTITSGETLSFNYTAGASGRVQDASNNIASNLASQAVTNNSSQSGAATDPEWANVTLLIINDDAAHGSGTITDQSTSAVSVSKAGASTLYSNVAAPTGMTTSVRTVESQSAYVRAASGAFANFGTGDYTIEAWIYNSTFTSGDWLMAHSNNAVRLNCTGANLSFGISGTERTFAVPAVDTFHHYAICRSGSTIKVFLNGVQQGADITNSTNYGDSSLTIQNTQFGSSAAGDGYIGPVRVTKAARYTSNFTPPSLPLPTS